MVSNRDGSHFPGHVTPGVSAQHLATMECLLQMALLCVHSLLTQIRALAPPGFSGSFRSADAYIKAFYLPWEELSRCAGAGHCQRLFTVNRDKCDALSRCGICVRVGVVVWVCRSPTVGSGPPKGQVPENKRHRWASVRGSQVSCVLGLNLPTVWNTGRTLSSSGRGARRAGKG